MRKKNPENKYYFSEREESAFVLYISGGVEEKHKIYNEALRKPLKKMIEIILRRYPIHIGNYEMSELEANALSHLIEHMIKFNPEKITKNGVKARAFSYCQTIV